MEKKFVFVDCETTGLDPSVDKMVELTYAVEDGPLKTLYFGVKSVPTFIDDLTKFTERGIDKMPEATEDEINEFWDACKGNTMVAANPAFDKAFIDKRGLWSFHYRMLDIESFAMPLLRLDHVPSMFEIVTELEKRGYSLTKPDHSSFNDVKALREAYNILRYM